MIDVVVVDDQALVRAGIRVLLGTDPEVRVVAEATDGREALEAAARTNPDLVLMDVRMPGMDGVEATRRLTEDMTVGDRLTKVLLLTTFNDDKTVYAALRAGASGFLLKESAPVQLLQAVRTVALGHAWIDPAVARQVIDALAGGPGPGLGDPSVVRRLTTREREVLVLLASGCSSVDIRNRLVLSEATVRTHISRILMKTGARDRTQAVVLAYRSGLVTVRPRPD